MEVSIIFYIKLERKREEIPALVHPIHFITNLTKVLKKTKF
jgi:hypothetical protein